MNHIALPNSAETDLTRQIFDLMAQLMADRWTSSNASVGMAAGGSNASMTVSDTFGNGYTINEHIAGPRVAVTPAGANLGPGETVQFTAALTDNTGADVPGAAITWALTTMTGGSGTISATGLYTAPAVIDVYGYDTITATDPASGSSMTVTVNLHP